MATEVVLALDIQCSGCEARTTTFELEFPAGMLSDPGGTKDVRVKVAAACPSCGKSVLFGEVPAKVSVVE